MPDPIIFHIRTITFRSILLFDKRFQIIVAAEVSPAQVDVVFGDDRILVWSEEGMDTAAHLLDTCQAPVKEGVLDIPADIRAGTAVVVDLPEALT